MSAGWCGVEDGGTVTQCYSTGEVSGGWYVGGLVGDNYSGTVTQCYSTGCGQRQLGVSAGWWGATHGGTVTQCYSTGAVSGNSHVGGLIGVLDRSGPYCDRLFLGHPDLRPDHK